MIIYSIYFCCYLSKVYQQKEILVAIKKQSEKRISVHNENNGYSDARLSEKKKERKEKESMQPKFSQVFKFQKRDMFFEGVKVELVLATKYTRIHHIPYTCNSCFDWLNSLWIHCLSYNIFFASMLYYLKSATPMRST